MIKRQIEIIVELMVKQKEDIILKAILGQDIKVQSLSSIENRCQFRVLPDGTEVFSFDGMDLIHFLVFVPEIKMKDNKMIMMVTQQFIDLTK